MIETPEKEIFKVSVNQASLEKLADKDTIKLFDQPRLDRNGEPMKNFVQAHFEDLTKAAEVYHKMGKLKVPAFRNWIG